MKTLIVLTANNLYTPYAGDYIQFGNCDVVFWDRLGIEKESKYIRYYDEKKKIRRSLLEYISYAKYVKELIIKGKYKKVVIFGLEIVFFLKTLLFKNKIKYVLDIRDDHVLRRFMNVNKVINKAEHVVLSSEKYKTWLPKSSKYLIAHNIRGFTIDKLDNGEAISKSVINFPNQIINIAAIGGIRDKEINEIFIKDISGSHRFSLSYNGTSDDAVHLSKFCKRENIENVIFTGLYKKEEEEGLYRDADMINVLRFPDSKNNITALPNRLYLGPIYFRPLVAFKDTYLSEIISTYNLGIVLNSLESIETQIHNYLLTFDKELYSNGRKNFLIKVVNENQEYISKIKSFIF